MRKSNLVIKSMTSSVRHFHCCPAERWAVLRGVVHCRMSKSSRNLEREENHMKWLSEQRWCLRGAFVCDRHQTRGRPLKCTLAKASLEQSNFINDLIYFDAQEAHTHESKSKYCFSLRFHPLRSTRPHPSRTCKFN